MRRVILLPFLHLRHEQHQATIPMSPGFSGGNILAHSLRGEAETATIALQGMNGRRLAVAKDPVCGVRVIDWMQRQCSIDESPYQREYQGLTYYFCSPECLRKFNEDPERHTKGSWLGGADLER